MFKTLIVDDREIFLQELKRIKVWGDITGFEITGMANNGNRALELLRKNLYDLVLTDIRMPVIDGLQLLKEIKKENLCPCVVLLSEYSEFTYARQGIIYGAFDYIVKPPTEEGILELLKRAGNYLKASQISDAENAPFADSSYEWVYPSAEEITLISYIINKNIDAVQLFAVTLDKLYIALKDNIIKADIIVKKLYHNIIIKTYEAFKWLDNFINPAYFNEVDYLHDGNDDTYKEFYFRKINYLVNFIIKYQPVTSDQNIKEICEYVLNNPEADLKLKVIAEKFYMNNTYLSNLFVTKTGIHYNDYITMVKIGRAEYLFRNSDLKTYEIGYQIRYRDINYFLKQFKKVTKKSAANYRNSDYSDYQI